MPESPDFLDEIADIIAASGIDHGHVVLELVETVGSDLPSRACTAMRIAEGVDTATQFQTPRGIGMDVRQGWPPSQQLPPQRRHPAPRAGQLPVPDAS